MNPLSIVVLVSLGLYGLNQWSKKNAVARLESRVELIREQERQLDNPPIGPSEKFENGKRVVIFGSPEFRLGLQDAGVPSSWADIRSDEGGSFFEVIIRESDGYLDAVRGDHYGIIQMDSAAWRSTVGKTDQMRGGVPVRLQAQAAALYILGRYGNPQKALDHSNAKGWI